MAIRSRQRHSPTVGRSRRSVRRVRDERCRNQVSSEARAAAAERREERGGGAITANAVPPRSTASPLPLLTITGTATSPAEATRLTIGATDAFINYARSRQIAERIPESQRVKLQIVKRASVPTLTAPRSKTKFIIILLAGLTATVAAAFVRDNMQRARIRESQPEPVSVLDPRHEGSRAATPQRVGTSTCSRGARLALRKGRIR